MAKYPALARLQGTIESIVRQDPGRRGFATLGPKNQLLPAARSLISGRGCLILTGFPVPRAQAFETDGPPGTAVLARALITLGKSVTVVTDRKAEGVLGSALDAVGCAPSLLSLLPEDDVPYETIMSPSTTHCAAIERPGRAADGFHHALGGEIISGHLAPLDDIFLSYNEKGRVTIGIGDGGNELGMGNVAGIVDLHVAPERPFACIIPSRFCICTGVSNWGAYGLAALLSALAGRDLMVSPAVFSTLMEAILQAGAVDGITGRPSLTVDNLPRSWEDKVYEALYRIAADHSEGPA